MLVDPDAEPLAADVTEKNNFVGGDGRVGLVV